LIAFPSNTSHFIQPADGPLFAIYKKKARINQATKSLIQGFGGTQSRFLDLSSSIKAYKDAASELVLKTSFSMRGIWPFDGNLIVANAVRSCPEKGYVVGDPNINLEYFSDKICDAITSHFTDISKVDRLDVEDVTNITAASELGPWRRRNAKRTADIPAIAPVAKRVKVTESSESEVEEEEESEMDWDEVVENLPASSPASLTALVCSNCDARSTHYRFAQACTSCTNYFLCNSCNRMDKPLQLHMGIHKNDENHRTRTSRQT
jgi:hypothetical protein